MVCAPGTQLLYHGKPSHLADQVHPSPWYLPVHVLRVSTKGKVRAWQNVALPIFESYQRPTLHKCYIPEWYRTNIALGKKLHVQV